MQVNSKQVCANTRQIMVKPREHMRSQIQGLHAAGHPISAIATIVKCDRNTVRKWINSPPGAVSDAKRAGRPTKITPNTCSCLLLAVR